MSEHASVEMWQVEVSGQVYDAPFEELPVWIAEGSLMPTDKVRKGELRWIEARRVPKLLPFFNAKASGFATPAINLPGTNRTVLPAVPAATVTLSPDVPIRTTGTKVPEGAVCSRHADVPSEYRCTSCGGVFCRACPSSYGGSVRICPSCGQFCKSISELRASAKADAQRDLPGKFGLSDFTAAVGHPLRFVGSLMIGGGLFAAFTVGQSAAAIGGIVLGVAGLFCAMLANAVSFGTLSHIIDRFAAGDLSSDILPSYEDFSLWEDVVQPFFIGIAAYLVSFGPFLATVSIGAYLIFSSIASQNQAITAKLETIPGTNYYTARETAKQSAEVKRVLTEIADRKDREIGDASALAGSAEEGTDPPPLAATPVPGQAPQDQEQLRSGSGAVGREQLDAGFGGTDPVATASSAELARGIVNLAAPLVVIGAIAFLWGLFVFPAIVAVGAYTRSFLATLNITVALDTIRRLGFDYAKLLCMSAALVVAWVLLASTGALLLSPFDLPRIGNIPATFISAFVGFYFYAAFACLIGRLLLRSADRLKLPR